MSINSRKALDVVQIQRLEKYVIQTVGIPSVVLMDNAGRAVAESILKAFKGKIDFKAVIVCGTGNNGGDGFVTARYLQSAGVKVQVFIVGSLKNLKNDPKIFHEILKALGVPVVSFKIVDQTTLKILKCSDVIIDALFGIGLNRPMSGVYEQIVTAINQSRRKVWSIDIPSGLNGSTGKVLGTCVKASTTVSFSCLKKGFILNDGSRFAGRIEIANIGIPRMFLRKFGV